jgi:class 3 adenylate cyclase
LESAAVKPNKLPLGGGGETRGRTHLCRQWLSKLDLPAPSRPNKQTFFARSSGHSRCTAPRTRRNIAKGEWTGELDGALCNDVILLRAGKKIYLKQKGRGKAREGEKREMAMTPREAARLSDPDRLLGVERVQNVVDSVITARQSKTGSSGGEEQGDSGAISAALNASRAALGLEWISFSVLTDTEQVTLGSSKDPKSELRGTPTTGFQWPVEKTICKAVVADPVLPDGNTKKVHVIETHPVLDSILGPDRRPGTGFYVGAPIEEPDSHQCIGTLCAIDRRKRTDVLPTGKDELFSHFATSLETQLALQARLSRQAGELKAEVDEMKLQQRLREGLDAMRREFKGHKLSQLTDLAADLGMGEDEIDELESRAEVIAAVRKLLLARFPEEAGGESKSSPAIDYSAMSFRELVKLASSRGLDAEEAESKTEVISLLEQSDQVVEQVSDSPRTGRASSPRQAHLDNSAFEAKIDPSKGPVSPWLHIPDTTSSPTHLPWTHPSTMAQIPAYGVDNRFMPTGDRRIPIPSDDAARVSVVRSYGYDNIEQVLDPYLENICTAASQTLGAFAGVNILSDETCVLQALAPRGTGLPSVFPRNAAACNFVVYRRKTVVLLGEDAERHSGPGICFYAGSPLTDPETGHVIGTFCMADQKPHPDFSVEQVRQLEQFAESVMQHLVLKKLRLQVHALSLERQTAAQETLARRGLPDEKSEFTAFCFTDIESSTSLWEAFPVEMNEAQRLHDDFMRTCIDRHHGHEVTTEGDAFFVAFHTGADAIEFCCDVQLGMRHLAWPAPMLADERLAESGNGVWRGLRVRMGVHVGCSKSKVHAVTHVHTYSGPEVSLAREVGDAAHGGQVVVSTKTWAGSRTLVQAKRGLSVIHLGEHLFEVDGSERTTQLVQVTPNELATRDFSSRPAVSLRQLSPSFFDSPTVDGKTSLVVCFILVAQKEALHLIDEEDETFDLSVDIVLRVVQAGLQRFDGYLCQQDEGTFMLAFKTVVQALRFAAEVHDDLREIPASDWPEKLQQSSGFSDGLSLRVGLFEGCPQERRPHSTTGRADYFGPTLNRAARVAYAANANQTLVPHSMVSPELISEANVVCRPAGAHTFKGIEGLVDVDDVASTIVSATKTVLPAITQVNLFEGTTAWRVAAAEASKSTEE